ncbi:MAG: hypothetical protein ACPG5R_04135 [Cognaticolwellia aestuarii]
MQDLTIRKSFRDFKLLLKAGATWVFMNIENGYQAADGLWAHLCQIQEEDCLTEKSVSQAYFAIRFVYLFEGKDAIISIVTGSYSYQSLWKLKVDETGSTESF